MGPPPDKAEGGGGEGAATSVRNVFSTSEFSKGPLSRFGDVFPLPIPVDDGFAGCVSGLASRRSRQRVHRRRTLMDRERGTVWALNHLAGFSDASTWPLSHLNAAQRHINSRIRRAHKERAPPAVQESPQAALRQLLRKKAGTYSSDQPGQLASYVRERLSLPKGQGEPVRLTEILPPRERHQLENFAAEMMLGDEEIAGVLERGLDGLRHIDPVLAHNPRRYHEFVADLYDCKLVGFTVTPKVQVGAFVVTKKGDRQRLIVDARRTNRLFRTPPSTNLGSIESWARLECNPGETLFMAQEDVKDFFYRLRIDQKLGEYFALPMVDPFMLQECLGYMPEELQALADRHEGPYYPFLTVLPMGFSWAFHLAHQAHMEVARRVLPESLLVKDRRPAVRMGRAGGECRSAMLIYADNNNHLGVDLSQVSRDQERVMEELHRHGLATHDIVHGCSLCESLGVRVDGLNGKVETTPKRDWRLDRALLACGAAPSLSGAELEVLVGHMTVRALLHRGMMSILRHSYVFIRSNYDRRTRLWDSVIHELELFRNLMVLGQADIFSAWDASPLITDACTSGYGVCEGQWDVNEVESVGREDERWRYHRGPPDRENPRAAALSTADVFDDPRSVLPDLDGELPFQLIENPMFPEVPKPLLSTERWRTLWCAPFDYKDTIHVLEARGILGAVKHRSRDQWKHGSRVLILNDNLGVVLAISKGRCADYGLLRIIRRIAAHSLATGIRFIVRWVPSELNIADGPSRTWEGQHDQYLNGETRHKKGCQSFHEGGSHQSQRQIEKPEAEGYITGSFEVEEPIFVAGENHAGTEGGWVEKATQVSQAQAGKSQKATKEVWAAAARKSGGEDDSGVSQRARRDAQELRAEAGKVLRVCPFLPVEHKDAKRVRRGAVRLRRRPVPQWRELQQWGQASGRVGTPPTRGSPRRAAAPSQVQEGPEGLETVSADPVEIADDRICQKCYLGSDVGGGASGHGTFQRAEFFDLRKARRAFEAQGGRLRGEECRFWALRPGAGASGKGGGHKSRDLRRDSDLGRREGPLARPADQEAGLRPNACSWRGCGHVGFQSCRLPEGVEVSGGGLGSGGYRKIPVSEPTRRCQPRSSFEVEVDSVDPAQGQMGLGLQCKDLRQAGATAAEHQQAWGPPPKIWRGSAPELSPLLPEWHVPAPARSEEEDGQLFRDKVFLSLFGGQAAGARFVAESGGRAAVVDLAHSAQNDLAKPSRWNAHSFVGVAVSLVLYAALFRSKMVFKNEEAAHPAQWD